MKKVALTISLAAALVVGTNMQGGNAAQVSERQMSNLPGCVYEDGSEMLDGICVWDGRHMGNGKGRSYLVIRQQVPRPWKKSVEREYFVYISHRQAHNLVH